MVSAESVEKQLKKVHFNIHGWGRTEASELANILMPDEEIFEVVNGIYEGGFALLVGTDIRVLLIDKKPMNYLTVEDLRFDMINELDYNHRLLGAHINISAGAKNLRFRSYNQARLRKLITHVQHCIAEGKRTQTDHQQDQNQHLEQINQQLQAYLLAQHQQQLQLQKQVAEAQQGIATPYTPEPVKPSPELADFLFTQSLLSEYQQLTDGGTKEITNLSELPPQPIEALIPAQIQNSSSAAKPEQPAPQPRGDSHNLQMADLYAEGMREIYGKRAEQQQAAAATTPEQQPTQPTENYVQHPGIEVNALRIAYSKLPMALRNRKFGRPSFHAHSQAAIPPLQSQPTPSQ